MGIGFPLLGSKVKSFRISLAGTTPTLDTIAFRLGVTPTEKIRRLSLKGDESKTDGDPELELDKDVRSPGVGPWQDLAGPFRLCRAAGGPGDLVDGPLKVQKDLELLFDREPGQLHP